MSVSSVHSLMMLALAAALAAVWWRAREPGTGVLALGFALAAAWYRFSELAPNTGDDIDTLPERVSAVTVGVTILLRTGGVLLYLGLPSTPWRRLLAACALPAVAMMGWLAAGGTLSHRVFHVGGLLPYLGVALLAFRRAAAEPGDGHALLGISLLVLPLLPWALGAAGIDPADLKYFTGSAVTVFGLLVLTVTLLHRHRALRAEVQRRREAEAQLRDANGRLEARVAERTAHLRELVAGLESFNHGVSHDLRGPLGGMSQLARRAADAMSNGDSTLARRALPLIADQCDASVRMVGAMLELARVAESPQQHMPVALTEAVKDAFGEVLLAQPPLTAGQVAPTLVADGLPWIAADPVLLRTVLVNLLGNAVKFSRTVPAPRIEVLARCQRRDVTVCVRDNGIGFDAEVAPRLFEPFYRGPGHAQDGHGLGLSLVRRAVEAMGGSVTAAPGRQGGAELCFRLPEAMIDTAGVPDRAALVPNTVGGA